MLYKFIDNKGSFVVKNPRSSNFYFPLTDKNGSLFSSISPNLAGDIKKDSEHFIMPPVSIEDLRSNLLCRRDFFLKKDNKVIRLSSVNPSDKVEIGFLYQKMYKKISGMKIEVTNFIPSEIPAEVMLIKVKNTTKKNISFVPTSFIPLYGRSERQLRDHRHVTSLLNTITMDKYGVYLKPTMIFNEQGHSINKDIYFSFGFEGNGKTAIGQFPTLDLFCGKGDLISPDAVCSNIEPAKTKKREFDGKENIASFRFKEKRLKPSESVTYVLLSGMNDDKAEVKRLFSKLNTLAKVEKCFSDTKKYWNQTLRELQFDFNDNNLTNWHKWVKLQPILRKLFGCSFLPHFDYGKGGRGWRDLWQDILALLLIETGKTMQMLLRNFHGVRLDGSNATIITSKKSFYSDRNKISRVWMDHGAWPYLTLRLYIHKTGDLGILLKQAPYFKDHLLRRAKKYDKNFRQKDYLLRNKNGGVYKGTVLEHLLVQHLVQFFNVGKHNIIKLENADWNDGLDMASMNGESVAFSFLYAHNIGDMVVLLEKIKQKQKRIEVFKELSLLLDSIYKPVNYKSYSSKQKRLEKYFDSIESISGKKISIPIDKLIADLKAKSSHMKEWLREKEWLKEGFFNGYYDATSKRVEGKKGKKANIILTSQVFAIMSGVATNQQIKKIWFSIKKYLKDNKFEGFRLNSNFKKNYIELGRAFGFAYGDKENGAFFNHMIIMLANALYRRGFVKEGYEVMSSIYKMAVSEKADIYPMIPEYFNGQGKGLYHYLTGSASWYVYTLMEQPFGVNFKFGDIHINPKLLRANFNNKRQIQTIFNWAGKRIILKYNVDKRLSNKTREKVFIIKEVMINKTLLLPKNGQYWLRNKVAKRSKKTGITIEVQLG